MRICATYIIMYKQCANEIKSKEILNMKSITKHDFILKVLIIIVCAAISINIFYIGDSEVVEADDGATEMRAVWVSTVANLDYPSYGTTDGYALRTQLDTILDNCADMGFNTIFFQVRPACDAFYNSSIFPWSRYLTGTQGVAPVDFDPLTYICQEAHKRGMQLHAWINPYRVTNSASDNDRLAANNPAVLRPDLVMTDNTGKMYLNPGEADSIDLIVNGVREIVENYDVDGIHFDDYFYPSDGGFDDSAAYYEYQDQYPNKADWRRSMVNTLIRCTQEAIKEIDPTCMFGVSPSGIWANASNTPGGSDTNGNSSYHNLYADTKYWVEQEWIDYIMPQLYWYVGQSGADYDTLLTWWASVCAPTNVKLYIGEAAYKAAGDYDHWEGSQGINELRTHISMIRNSPYADGYSMFTYGSFRDDPDLVNMIKDLNSTPVEAPTLGGSGNAATESEPDPEPTQAPAAEPTQAPAATQEPAEDQAPTEAPAPTQVPNQTTTGTDASRFTDMGEYEWAMDAINELTSEGIIRGISDTEFGPDMEVTRADCTVMLFRVLGNTDVSFTDNFSDVTPDKYYYEEIGMAKALGIAYGVGNNLFNPEGRVLRQDMATMTYRVLRDNQILTSIPNTAKALNNYADWMQIDFYARDAVAACVENNLMGGYGDGTINPQGHATRIEVALFMQRVKTLIDNHQVAE